MEKVGKMVFKMKPSKSGINKLPLFRQFRPACKNWGSFDETFCRTWKFPAKRYMYNFYSTFAREGPLPLPNCFFCYTRPSRGNCFAPPTRPISFTHPPDQSGHDYHFSIWSSNEKLFVILHHLKNEGAGFYLANYPFGGKKGLIFDASLPENLIKKNNLPGFSSICWPHFRSVSGHDVV